MEYKERKQIRLKNYDYSQQGKYFITICTKDKQCIFGTIKDGLMCYSELGIIAHQEVIETNKIRKNSNIRITNFVIMPNHIHLLIEIVGTRRAVSTHQNEQFSKPTKQSVSTVVRAYKSSVTRRIHKLFYEQNKNDTKNQVKYNNYEKYELFNGHGTPCPYTDIVWQSRFHDHIIHDEKEYWKIVKYIKENPIKWEDDCLYTINKE